MCKLFSNNYECNLTSATIFYYLKVASSPGNNSPIDGLHFASESGSVHKKEHVCITNLHSGNFERNELFLLLTNFDHV